MFRFNESPSGIILCLYFLKVIHVVCLLLLLLLLLLAELPGIPYCVFHLLFVLALVGFILCEIPNLFCFGV